MIVTTEITKIIKGERQGGFEVIETTLIDNNNEVLSTKDYEINYTTGNSGILSRRIQIISRLNAEDLITLKEILNKIEL